MENLVDYENLIVDIVSRLPVESVLQCRCVCKSWRALLRETYFTQVHTDRTLQQQQQQQQLLLLDDYDDDYDSSSSSPVSFFNLVCFKETDSHEFHLQDYYVNKYISSSKVNRPLSPPPSLRKEDEDQGRSREQILLSKLCPSIEKKMDWEIVGSCNGLICLYGLKSTYYDYNYYNTFPLIIYNPITREYLKLPLVDHSQCTTINNIQYVTCGFGYLPSTKEYKIVRIIYQRAAAAGSKSSSYVIWVQIYTLGGRSSSSSSEGKWRTKKEQEETCKDCLCSTTPGVPFNGALYWVRIVDITVATLKKRMIISIDLADEKFQTIPSPPLSVFYSPCFRYSPRYGDVCLDTELGVLGQNLCISLRTNLYTDIWIMHDNNNNNNTAECSWSKKFSIPATLAKPIGLLGLNNTDGFPLYQSIGLTKKGRVLCIFDQKYLVSFDPITKSLKSLGCMRLFESQSRKIFYTKSFVSLKALGEENAEILKSVVAAPANANTNKKGTVGMQKQYYWRRRRRN